MGDLLTKFMKDESGATMVEYAIMVALIAIAVAVIVAAVGQQLNTLFNKVVQCLAQPNTTNCTFP